MNGNPIEVVRFFGNRRKQRDIRIEWAMDHVPALAVRSKDAVGKIIDRAHDDTNAIQKGLQWASAIIGGFAGYSLNSHIGVEATAFWESAASVAVGGYLLARGTDIAAESLFRRKIRNIAGGIGSL